MLTRLVINEQKLLFLMLCEKHKKISGACIVEESEKRIPKGTVYSIGNTLEVEGFVTSEIEVAVVPGKINSKLYSLTEKGKYLLKFWIKLNQFP